MKRLYYLADNVNTAERVSDRLHAEGITDWNFHVLGHDKAKIVRHHLHSTTPLHELDIIRSGERGILVGIAVGILFTSYITFFTAFGRELSLAGQLTSIVFFALFGAWVGGLVGVSTENYKIRHFHDDIKQGKYLLLVDVHRDQKLAVDDVVSRFPSIKKVGEDSTFINPFAREVTS